jgi:predicted nucleic acid-binding protein
LTVGEIEKGITKMPASKRKTSLEEVLENLILRFENRVLAINTAVMRRWGKLVGSLEKKGRVLPVIDSLLAATALEHDLVIVTRNKEDFALTGAQILDIWS